MPARAGAYARARCLCALRAPVVARRIGDADADAETDTDTQAVAFGLATGGVLCPDCRPGQPHVATLSGRTLNAIRVLAEPGGAWRDLDASPRARSPVRTTLGHVISHLMGRPPRLSALSRSLTRCPWLSGHRNPIPVAAAAGTAACARPGGPCRDSRLLEHRRRVPLPLAPGDRLVAFEGAHRRGGERQPQPDGRWLSPKKNPHSDPDTINPPTPLILGSNGYKPLSPLKNAEADAEFEVGERLFQQGKFEESPC